MKKVFVLSLVLLVLGATAAYGVTSASKVRVDRTNAQSESKAASLTKVNVQGVGSLDNARRVRNCGTKLTGATLQCLNTQVKFLDQRVARSDAVLGVLLECLGIAPVNQYYGYEYSDGTLVWPETALDFREEGDTYAPDVWMLGWLCEV